MRGQQPGAAEGPGTPGRGGGWGLQFSFVLDSPQTSHRSSLRTRNRVVVFPKCGGICALSHLRCCQNLGSPGVLVTRGGSGVIFMQNGVPWIARRPAVAGGMGSSMGRWGVTVAPMSWEGGHLAGVKPRPPAQGYNGLKKGGGSGSTEAPGDALARGEGGLPSATRVPASARPAGPRPGPGCSSRWFPCSVRAALMCQPSPPFLCLLPPPPPMLQFLEFHWALSSSVCSARESCWAKTSPLRGLQPHLPSLVTAGGRSEKGLTASPPLPGLRMSRTPWEKEAASCSTSRLGAALRCPYSAQL